MSSPPVCDQWFSTEKVSDGLYLITEPHYYWWNRANLWLIKGQTQDLLIDTGLGVSSLLDILHRPKGRGFPSKRTG